MTTWQTKQNGKLSQIFTKLCQIKQQEAWQNINCWKSVKIGFMIYFFKVKSNQTHLKQYLLCFIHLPYEEKCER